MIDAGREVRPVFQSKVPYGAVIRAAFDGSEPQLPQNPLASGLETAGDDFWPDEEYSDEPGKFR